MKTVEHVAQAYQSLQLPAAAARLRQEDPAPVLKFSDGARESASRRESAEEKSRARPKYCA